MIDPGVHTAAVERGVAAPMPQWVAILRACGTLHCSPWEVIDSRTPRRVWLWWALVLNEADALVEQWRAEERQRESRNGRARPLRR